MTQSLSIRNKLIYSYIAVALLTALTIYLLARVTSRFRLRELLLDQQVADIQLEVANWYTIERDWDGFENYFNTLHPDLGANDDRPPPPTDVRPGAGRPQRPRIGVLNANRQTLIQTFATDIGETFPEVHMNLAEPVEVEGSIVAYVVRDDDQGVGLFAEEIIYQQNINQVLAIASIGGIVLAILMGIGLARVLIRPIHDLTTASQAMADGNLEQQVPIHSNDELGQLAATFNRMSHDLAEATRQRRQMTADIAHDLSTPLQVISGYIEAIQDGMLAPTPERIRLISAEIEHLRRLINDLDLLAKTDTRSLHLQMRPINISAFLDNFAESFSPLAAQENVAVQAKIAQALPAVEADQERLMQVMGNLMSNALRYTPAGGEIVIAGNRQRDHVIIQVRDNGSGIAAEDLPHIFDRFYRADASRTEGGKMGLGLAISKALVEAMGGKISAESQGLHHGTTIRISLPILRSEI